MEDRIDGLQATYLDLDGAKRKPVQLEPATEDQETPSSRLLPPRQNGSEQRKAPPRVRNTDDRCVAPTTDLEKYRKCLRETFGNTLPGSTDLLRAIMEFNLVGVQTGRDADNVGRVLMQELRATARGANVLLCRWKDDSIFLAAIFGS